MSYVFYWVTYLRARLFFYLNSGAHQHAKKVSTVVAGIQGNASSANPKKMCTARPGWANMSISTGEYKKKMYQVDLSSFVDVLKVDPVKETITVEPLVDMGQISQVLLPLGWTLAVLPELDDLTVGGLISGFGIESSSFKHGLFQHVCKSFEFVLADGSLITCDKDNNAELYYNIPWAHGTLGFLLSAEIKIVRCGSHVALDYQPFYSMESFMTGIENAIDNEENEFIEALSYSKDKFVLMTGTFTNTPEKSKIHEIGAYHGPWFYKHVEKFLTPTGKWSGPSREYIPLRSYYHRHTRSLFWEMEDILPFGDHWLFRYTLGWLLPPKVGFLKLSTGGDLHDIYMNKHVDQDLLIPLKDLPEFYEYQDGEFDMYPQWLCPMNLPKTPVRGLVNPPKETEMFIDVGIYGVPTAARPHGGDCFEAVPAHQRLEKVVRKMDGFQALYAYTYQNRSQFEEMFDHKNYNQLREKYGCEGLLPTIYDKISLRARGETKQADLVDKLTKE
eukprot:TRINITY_DN8714_c0_g1_i1.p1 TRINITY_DN8714_c0_g1~~TRINITY_DN8714_c0_g1_i1.p1  ORF type:complete len:563 (+),score=148.24 TRINITY_DN8714_c0_g1_i1:185-1690(+)